VHGIGYAITISFVQRVVGNRGTKTCTASLGKSVCGTTSEQESSTNSGDDDTSDNTSGETGDETDRETASSGTLYIASLFVGLVASSESTVISGGANNVEQKASLFWMASRVLANVGGRVTDNSGMNARAGYVGGERIALIDGASVVVVTKVLGNRLVFASSFGFARIISTGIVVVTRRCREPYALGGEVIIGVAENAAVNGTHVVVLAIDIGETLGLRRAKIGGLDFSGDRVTLVCSAERVDWNRYSGLSASGRGIARVNEAQVGLVAEVVGLGSEDTLGGQRFHIVSQDTSVIGTHVTIVTISTLSGNRTNNSVRAHPGGNRDDTHIRDAREVGASGVDRDGHDSIDTSGCGIARICEAHVELVAEIGGLRC
jgi:hypothetical protein